MKKKDFNIIRRAKSFTHATRGISLILQTQENFWIHIVATVITIFLGIHYNISIIEWTSIVVVVGLVLVSEAFNTAIEIDIDLTSPNYHPYAKDTKDVAAGAVLISSVIALIVGFIIFIPKIFL